MGGKMQKLKAIVAFFIISLLVGAQSIAQSSQYKQKKAPVKKTVPGKKTETKKAKSDSDKLDISDLEKKYWSPKDTEFSVVQNRTYSKVKKIGLSLQYGPVINDGYSSGQDLALSVNYYPKERYGYEFRYSNSDLSNNDVVKAFIKDVAKGSGILPDHGKIKSHMAFGFNWIPVYAKVSFLDKRIIYFDMAISPKIGMVTYEQQARAEAGGNQIKSAPTIGFDLTQFFFINRHLAFRADIQNFWFNEEVLNYSSGAVLRSNTTNHTAFLVGVTYYF